MTLVPHNSLPTQKRKAKSSCSWLPTSPRPLGPWGAQQGLARAQPICPGPGPPWLGPQSPYPTPRPVTCPQSPPASSQPRAEEGCVLIAGRAQLPVFLQVNEVRLLLDRDMGSSYGPTEPNRADGLSG